MSLLDEQFMASLASLAKPVEGRFRWYLTAVVAIGALNYPEEIPGFYRALLERYIPEAEQKKETRKIVEGLTKVCGIQGAAKTGNATRALATAIPGHLKDDKVYRADQTFEEARQRGQRMIRSIYAPNPDYDGTLTKAAAPDYSWIVTNLFYGYIFSFDEILGPLETGQVIIATLHGIDCQEQLKNHMIGMMLNGAERKDLFVLRDIVTAIAQRLNVKFKGNTPTVPETPIPKPLNTAEQNPPDSLPKSSTSLVADVDD